MVITGASTGIGEACALHLDALGFRVFAGVRKEPDGEALRQRASDRLTPLFIDLTEPASIAAAAQTVTDALDGEGLAGLVNNAGIAVAGPVEFVPIAEVRRQFEVNVTGQIAVTQAFLPLLRKARGRVVNMGSSGGRWSKPFMGTYCASKFALRAVTDALRIELRPWGIHVSLVEPGAVTTPIWEKSMTAAEVMLGNFPQRAHDLYGRAFAVVRQYMMEAWRSAVPPGAVAKAVAHALTARRPRIHYFVGRDARLMAACARLLPDWLLDRLILWYLYERRHPLA